MDKKHRDLDCARWAVVFTALQFVDGNTNKSTLVNAVNSYRKTNKKAEHGDIIT